MYGNDFILIDTAAFARRRREGEDIEFYSVLRSFSAALEKSDVCIIVIAGRARAGSTGR